MNEAALLQQVKDILMIQGDGFDSVLQPRILAVTGYLRNAGVSEQNIDSPTGVVAVALGANDLWNLTSGEQKFSPGFLNLATQLQNVVPGDDGDVEP